MRLALLTALAASLGITTGCSDTVPPVTVDLTAVTGDDLGARDFALPDLVRRPDFADAAAPPDLAPCIPSPPVPPKLTVPDTCKMGRWTWQNPLPQPNRLWAVHGASANDAWAVGRARTLLHWDGKLWTRVVLPWAPFGDLTGVWAADAQEAWTVGQRGAIFRWNGTAWSEVKSPVTWDLWAVRGFSRSEVFAAGEEGVLRWDGQQWKVAFAAKKMRAIGGTSGRDVWVVGEDHNFFLHWDGAQWDFHLLPGLESYRAVWAASPTDAWAVGERGRSRHFDGLEWKEVATGLVKPNSPVPWLSSVWGSGPKDVWAGGEGGLVLRWDGAAWQRVKSPLDDVMSIYDYGGIHGSWGPGPGAIWWVGDEGYILRWDGKAISFYSPPGAPNVRWDLTSVWGTGAKSLWATGHKGILRWQGNTWDPLQPAADKRFGPVSGLGERDVWAASEEEMWHWDGNSWRAAPGRITPLRSLWGSRSDDFWGLGSRELFHWDGKSWSLRFSPGSHPTSSYWSIWGASAADVWAVGGSPLPILHWDGRSWARLPNPAPDQLFSVHGSGARDVWAAGSGALFRWDGCAWGKVEIEDRAAQQVGVVQWYDGLWVAGPNELWFTEAQVWSRIFHWKNGVIECESGDSDESLLQLWGLPGGELWAVGANGRILHRAP